MSILPATVFCGAAAFLLARLYLSFVQRSNLPLGPKGDWIIGNLSDVLSEYQWKTFSSWSKVFGDVTYLNVLGRPVIVLNKLEHARELMERRSALYSDRPRMEYIVGMVKIRSVTFMPYGDVWRLHRRLLQQCLNPRAVIAFRPLQTRTVRNLLDDLLIEPEAFWRHVKHFSASTILSATYGYTVARENDPLVKLNEHSERAIVKPGPPGATIADFIPLLRYVPSFMPGAKFKRYAIEAREALYEMATRPYETVKQQRNAGTVVPSLLSRMLDDYEQLGVDDQERREAIKDVCGAMYRAGVGTSSATLYVFILAMVLHPKFAKKAQNELDTVLGGERLPTFEDQGSLPYINCIMKECLRWGPAFPLGISHRAMEEGELEGKRIPKGSMIMPNIWHMMHDERNYVEPDAFNPDRFVKSGDAAPPVLDPAAAVFGFGRRICPGRHFAEASVWLAISNILAVFDIIPALDKNGAEVLPNVEFTPGLNSWPKEYKCRFMPRNDKAVALVRNAGAAGF